MGVQEDTKTVVEEETLAIEKRIRANEGSGS